MNIATYMDYGKLMYKEKECNYEKDMYVNHVDMFMIPN